MRISQLLLPTVKEDPAGAEAVSHKLMVRAGLVRQVAAGVYVFLPAGWRVMQRIAGIIRHEMDAIGCQELLMPVINPAELWQESGRYDEIGEELFRLKDRKGAPMVLAMTHEECITWIAAREIRSYKELPQLWYHIQTKERDEARPKSGILRTREFIMKDSYSLDVSEEALQESYRLHIGAYDTVFRRCGLRFLMVQSDPGMMGGRIAHEYMAPSEAGEDEVVVCAGCGYAANVELAAGVPAPLDPAGASAATWAEARAAAGEPVAEPAAPVSLPAEDLPASERLQLVHTPDTRTIDEVTAYVGLPAERFIKSLVVVSEPGAVGAQEAGADAGAGTPGADQGVGADGASGPETPSVFMVLLRGDHELQESKLRKLIGDFRMATAEEVLAAQGAPAGFVGPVRHEASADGGGLAAAAPLDAATGGASRAALAGAEAIEAAGRAPLPVLADEALREGVYVTGANLADHHLAGVIPADWAEGARWVDVRKVAGGDSCPDCDGPLELERVIEVGNIFQLGTKYSIPMGATYLAEDGSEHPIVMGSYGIGLARIAAAAVEQHHDDDGIVWPASIAPWDVHLVCVKPGNDAQRELADRLHAELERAGLRVVYDDRRVSPGIKFKDADLLGCPVQVVVGKKAADGVVELKHRSGSPDAQDVGGVPAGPGERTDVAADEVVARAVARIDGLLAALA